MRVLGGRGRVRVRLDEFETELLARMFNDLAELVEQDAFDEHDPVRARLYPLGYRDDIKAADDFRDLTERSLRIERAERARACIEDVHEPGEIVLDADGAERWIQVINDLRLALGTRLDITDERDADAVDAQHPQAQEWAIYHWLTGLQDSIVGRLH